MQYMISNNVCSKPSRYKATNIWQHLDRTIWNKYKSDFNKKLQEYSTKSWNILLGLLWDEWLCEDLCDVTRRLRNMTRGFHIGILLYPQGTPLGRRTERTNINNRNNISLPTFENRSGFSQVSGFSVAFYIISFFAYKCFVRNYPFLF